MITALIVVWALLVIIGGYYTLDKNKRVKAWFLASLVLGFAILGWGIEEKVTEEEEVAEEMEEEWWW
jgi:hypothetical protein